MENPSFVEKFSLPFSTLWEKHKIFLIIFGLLIVIVKFREVIMDFLIASARAAFNNAKEKDADLANRQNDANNRANQIIDNAEKLDDTRPNIDEDWHKK